MIGTISIECNAKNPNMPLHPLRAYVGSPSSLRIINVPKKIGNWQIKSVTLTTVYPDASVQTASCVLVGGVWVGTIAGCSTAGSNQNGYTIYASGIDENGLDVEGYVLGKGDVVVLESNGQIPENAIAQLSAEVQNKRDYDDMCIPAQPSDTTPIWFGDIECDWDAESESWKSANGLVEISRVGSSDNYDVTAYSQLIPEEVVWIKARVTLALPTYKAYVKAGGTSPDILIRSFDGSIATESYVDEAISNISGEIDLSAYATTEYVDGIVSGKADVSSLNDYYTKSETSSSIEIQDALDGKADVSSLNDYYLKNETSSATQLETAFSNISVDMSDYYTKNETSSAVEIQDALDGKQPTGDYALASQIPTNVSQLSNDAGYLTEHQSLSDYYTKNETSSNIELNAKFETKADLSAIPTKTSELSNDSGFITLAQVPTPSYIEDAIGNRISANLSCTYIDDTAWEVTDPSSNKYVLDYVGFIQSHRTWECVEPENIKMVLTYANEWELQVYTWQEIGPGGDYDWVLDINGSYNEDSDITTIPYFENAGTTYNYSAQRPVTKNLTLATNEIVEDEIKYDNLAALNISSIVQLEDRTVQAVNLTSDSTIMVLPALTNGKTNDFVLDVTNNAGQTATFSLSGSIGVNYNILVPEGESFAEMTTVQVGEIAEYYLTKTAFDIGGLPTWKIVKQTVEKYTI